MYGELGSKSRASMAFGTLAEATDDAQERRVALEKGEQLLSSAIGDTHLNFFRDAMEASLRAEEWHQVDRYARKLETLTHEEPMPWSDFFIARARVLAAFARIGNQRETVRELRHLRDEAQRVRMTGALPALEKALALT